VNIPAPVVEWCRARGWGEITEAVPLGGGCIHSSYRLRTAGGPNLFLKVNTSVPHDMFEREADGLLALRVDGGPRLPQPLLWSDSFLLLEDLAPGPQAPDYWDRLGQELARIHARTSPRFGFANDNYLGLTPQPNSWTDDGWEFFATQRLRFQMRRARQADLLDGRDGERVEAIADRLTELIPAAPACLIHGDLWSGNVLRGPQGEPCLIDPACHYGWAEAELAMTALFGGFPDRFYQAYVDSRAMPHGWRERFPVYNLYHLLNHLNLFGAGYLGSVRAVLREFA
jgi:fructosamine-3-kinase